MDLAEQALEMVQHSLQQRRQQAAVQVPAVMTSQAYQKCYAIDRIDHRKVRNNKPELVLDRHKSSESEGVGSGIIIGKKDGKIFDRYK